MCRGVCAVDVKLDVIYYLLMHWPDALAVSLPIDRAAVVANHDESLQADTTSHQADNAPLVLNVAMLLYL
jgi:hypothetical protein